MASAQAQVAATAGGAGRLADLADATRDSSIAFADAVCNIVTDINRSYSRDGCLNLMTALARTGSLRGVTAVAGGGADIEKAQQRVIELCGTLARQDEIPNDLSKKADTVPAAIWADAREKYERADAELKFAIENLKQAQTAAERT